MKFNISTSQMFVPQKYKFKFVQTTTHFMSRVTILAINSLKLRTLFLMSQCLKVTLTLRNSSFILNILCFDLHIEVW